MTKLDEIQEYRNILKRSEDAYATLMIKYSMNLNIINRINIFLLNRIMKKFKIDVENEINKIRERKD